MQDTYQQLGIFNEYREQLVSLARQQMDVLDALHMDTWQRTVHQLEEVIMAESFKVLVLGEFKRGKSTFINALLGAEVLPAYAIPCTAIINEVKWGEQRKALLHFKKLTDGTPPPPPQDVPVDQLEEYVVIKDFSKKEQEVRDTPYEKVELFWPLALCSNGVEIIDSPGLNESKVRQQITLDYLGAVDAVLFVLSCEALGPSISEDSTIENLRSAGHEDIFFICNRYDALNSAKDREMVRRHGLTQLAPRTKRGSERVFFISAYNGLEGQLHGDMARLEQSGVPQLKAALEKFLATERGRIKILRPAHELKASIYEARRVMPEREDMLRTDVSELEARYQQAQEPLRRLQAERQHLVQKITNFVEDMKRGVREKARGFLHQLTEQQVSKWTENYELQHRVGVKLEWPASQIEKAVNEIVEHLSHKMEGEFATWQQHELQPYIETGMKRLEQEMDASARAFIRQVDALRFSLAAGAKAPSVELEGAQISPLERVLAAAGGLLLGDLVTGGIGAVFGYKAMIVSLIQQIAIAVVTLILVGFNPLILIPALISGGIVQAIMRIGKINESIKQKVAEKLADEIRASSYERADEIAAAVATKLSDMRAAVDQGLANEIRGVQQQVESILAEKQKGQANVDRKIRELQVVREQLDAIDGRLDDLIGQVALS